MKVLFFRIHRNSESVSKGVSKEIPKIQIDPLYLENLRIMEIMDWDRSQDPKVRALKAVCDMHNFNIRTEFICNFILRMNREQKIADIELHKFLILIESAAAM